MKRSRQYLIWLAAFVLVCLTSGAKEPEFLSLTAMGPYETPSRYVTGTITYNLGPIGARGWVRGHGGGKLFWGEYGKEILVTWVYPGAPADGILKPFDVIVGAGGKTFDQDARIGLGRAMFAAEKKSGRLKLRVWRDGEAMDVTIALPRLDADAAVTPILPKHSKAVRERCLDFMMKTMHPNGFRAHPVYRGPNALFLLAHQRPEHLDAIRRNVRKIIDSMPKSKLGPWNWVTGTDAIVLSEYFLLTGDRSVLPALEQLCKWFRTARSYAGGWGHGPPYGGYGHVGHPGMFAATGCALARECGITGYDDVIRDAQKFYSRGAGLGMMTYGGEGGSMNLKTIYGDNGKSGTAAVFFSVVGDKNTTRTFAQMAAALGPYSQSGHTGHYWSYSWGALGAGLSDQKSRRFFAKQTDWYYTLSRTWRGGITTQPWMLYWGSYSRNGAETNTGGMALWYCQPLKSLRILGGPKSVFSLDLKGPLAEARQCIYDKKYRECVRIVDQLKIESWQQGEQAAELRRKAQLTMESIKLTLKAIDANIEKGDLYLAERQVNALKPILPDPSVTARFEKDLGTKQSIDIIAAGATYYHLIRTVGNKDHEFFHRAPAISVNPKDRQTMVQLAANTEAGIYEPLAVAALKRWPAEAEFEPVKLIEEDFSLPPAYSLYQGKGSDAAQGVKYRYYEFTVVPKTVEEIRKMSVVKEGVTKDFDLSPRKRNQNFAFIYKTFVEIDKAGEYTFTLTSDDGSYLHVNGKLLVDNGGLHGMVPKQGTIQLAAGRHELECIMFQAAHGYGLTVDMAPANGDGPKARRAAKFAVAEPVDYRKLKLSVNTKNAVSVSLNGQVICRFPKKRREGMFDYGYKDWEDVTLKPAALALLRKGSAILTVETAGGSLKASPEKIGVRLQGFRVKATPE